MEKLINSHDAYVNDAFGVSHRSHASVVGPPTRLPSAAGFLLQREIEVLGRLLGSPARPFIAVVGGAKVADKLGVLKALLDRVDLLVVGGGMSYTFLAAQPVTTSETRWSTGPDRRLCRSAGLGSTHPLAHRHRGVGARGTDFGCDASGGEVRVVGDGHPRRLAGAGHGSGHRGRLRAEIGAAATVLWNGPMGVFEDARFNAGTAGVARAMAESAGFTVVGGGDSVSAVYEAGLADQIDFISTGGGASLELLEYGRPSRTGRPPGCGQRPVAQAPRRRPVRPVTATPKRRPLISGNWKMNFDHLEALHAARDLGLRLQPGRCRARGHLHPPAFHRHPHGAVGHRARGDPDRTSEPRTAPSRMRAPSPARSAR